MTEASTTLALLLRLLAAGAAGPAGEGRAPGSASASAACTCPCPAPAALVPRPDPAAFADNRRGFELYRARRFAEARGAYQAAIDRDPSFVAPRLNIACAFAQEERFADAVAAAAALLRLRYVPWAREVAGAADLAPLVLRPEAADLRRQQSEAAAAWGAPLAHALLFVGRTAPPLRLPAAGVLVLAPAQEVFAYLPNTGELRQVTAEDGRVLALLRSPDRQRIAYLAGGKLVRAPGQPDVLRGLVLRWLELATMSLGPPQPLPGDVRAVRLGWAGPERALVELTPADGPPQRLQASPAGLLTLPGGLRGPRLAPGAVTLTTAGVEPSGLVPVTLGPCRFVARDGKTAAGTPEVRAQSNRMTAGVRLGGAYGAGLFGLPFASPK